MKHGSVQDLEAARKHIKHWLKESRDTPSGLASRAGMNRSVMHRFLHGGRLDLTSAAKIYEVVHGQLAIEEKRVLLNDLGLYEVAQSIASTLTNNWATVFPNAPSSRLGCGLDLFAQANKALEISPSKALPLFLESERTLIGHPTLAALVACQHVQILINTGAYHQAQIEALRISSMYGPTMGSDSNARYVSIRAWLAFDLGHLIEAHQWFSQLANLGQTLGYPRLISEALMFQAMIRLEAGQHKRSPESAKREFSIAYRLINQHLDLARAVGDSDVQLGFSHLRQAEIQHALGHHSEAANNRRKVRQLFSHAGAINHIDVVEARLALLKGDVKQARRLSEKALSIALHIDYGLGAGRALHALSLSAKLGGNLASAVEYAIAALCLAPTTRDEFGQGIRAYAAETITEADRQLTAAQIQRQRFALTEKINTRQGQFAALDKMVAGRQFDISQIADVIKLGHI